MASAIGNVLRRRIANSATLLKEIEFSAATAGGHGGGFKFWRNLSFFVGFPAVTLCMVNCYLGIKDGHPEPPPFVKYDYLRVRTKKFPWGDGNHSFIHNPHTNPLPDGYEEHH